MVIETRNVRRESRKKIRAKTERGYANRGYSTKIINRSIQRILCGKLILAQASTSSHIKISRVCVVVAWKGGTFLHIQTSQAMNCKGGGCVMRGGATSKICGSPRNWRSAKDGREKRGKRPVRGGKGTKRGRASKYGPWGDGALHEPRIQHRRGGRNTASNWTLSFAEGVLRRTFKALWRFFNVFQSLLQTGKSESGGLNFAEEGFVLE